VPVRSSSSGHKEKKHGLTRIVAIAGRVGLQAFKRYKAGGAAGAIGKSFYKGGFESRMNRREAALILQLRYDLLGGGGHCAGARGRRAAR
jgi:hypothetical protein